MPSRAAIQYHPSSLSEGKQHGRDGRFSMMLRKHLSISVMDHWRWIQRRRDCFERFVILLYDHTNSCISVNELRKELFTRGRSIDKIPPTSGVLFQHDRRTAYQGGYIWGETHEKLINPPEATNWGWQKDKNGRYHPLWTLLPIASKACSQLIKCCSKNKNDRFNCSGRCSCVKVRQTCTELCKCKAGCPHSLKFKDSDNHNGKNAGKSMKSS